MALERVRIAAMGNKMTDYLSQLKTKIPRGNTIIYYDVIYVRKTGSHNWSIKYSWNHPVLMKSFASKLKFHWRYVANSFRLWLGAKQVTSHWPRYVILYVVINSLRPSDAYWHQYNIPTLVQIMACRLFCAKPLSGPMLPYCQLESKEYISVKFFIQGNANENVISETVAILSDTHSVKPQWFNSLSQLVMHRCSSDCIIIGSANRLTPDRQQAITWTNDDPVHWHIYASSQIIQYCHSWTFSNKLHRNKGSAFHIFFISSVIISFGLTIKIKIILFLYFPLPW